MNTVSELLHQKNSGIIFVNPDTTVYEALSLMAEKEIGAVLVMEGDTLGGIFSERDYARKVALLGRSSKEIAVREIMTEKVITVDSACQIEHCMKIMTARRIRHLPIMEGEKVIGVVSIGDILKSVLQEKEFVISQLEQYIGGERLAP